MPEATERRLEGPEHVAELVPLSDRHFAAREGEGRLWTFRLDEHGAAEDLRAAALDDVTDLFPLSWFEAYVQRAGGEVRCFGPRAPATTPDDDAMIVRGLPRLTHIEDGAGHTCGLTARGVVYCWGARGPHVGSEEPR